MTAVTPDERRAYQRGYNAGTSGKLPIGALATKLPASRWSNLVAAALAARNAITDHFAVMDADARTEDRFGRALSAAEDALYDAIAAIDRDAANTAGAAE